MERLEVERLGGLAGFGNPSSHLRASGNCTREEIGEKDWALVLALFARTPKAAKQADGFRYRLTHLLDKTSRTIEAAEDDVPASVQACVRDSLV